ncbi:MAG: cyclic nucleotide-binding domain-containing protein, partial [Elusimicrobiota bacterium]
GTMDATLVNVTSGGTTRLSGILCGAFSLGAFLLLARLVAWVPVPALAGILIVVAARMYDRKSFRLLRKRSTLFDFGVGATVIVTAVAADLIMAAGVGLGMSILLFIRDQIRGHVIRRKAYGNRVFSKQRRLPEETALLEERGDQTVVCELQGSLFFGTTDQLFTELEEDLKTRKFVLLDMRRVVSVDFTAIHMLKQIEDHLHDRQGRLLLCSLPPSLPTGQDLAAYFSEVGLLKATRNVDVFDSIDDALEWVEDRLLAEAAPRRDTHESVLSLREVDLMRKFDEGMLEAMKGCLREASFKAGERVFAKGERGDELYLIRRGKVRILLPLEGGKTYHLATLAQGDFFGEVSFLDHDARSASAVASTPVEIYAFSRARFDELARSQPDMGVRVFARLARALALRLRQTDGELRALQES